MRTITLFNDGWTLIDKENKNHEVSIPHTWNATDGQDGGNDYYRGTSIYIKKFITPKEVLYNKAKAYLEFRGVNLSVQIKLNGNICAVHEGGYATFRVELKNLIWNEKSENELVVIADNSKNDSVYPQKADFTFYGGIYRDIYMVLVPNRHFSLNYYGGIGVKITPTINGKNAVVHFEAFVENEDVSNVKKNQNLIYQVRFSITGVGSIVANIIQGMARASIEINNARLWNGRIDPYLYDTKVELLEKDTDFALKNRDTIGINVLDEVNLKIGCRSFDFDSEKGFILNNEPYALRGVSRHQDRKGVGNAITPAMQEEDIKIIMEMGATTVRLAHYQHDQYFYDLCDKYGLIVWTEIPYISEHMPNANKNICNQLKELIVQNYNHPSIVCWGLSNEITITKMSDDLRKQHKILNNLSHELDSTRPTTMAHVNFLDPNDPLVHLTDICSYNLYFGWYFGELEDNEKWFDKFHTTYPNRIIGLSEYGADANIAFQSTKPERGDYSEQYQCLYHEHLLQVIMQRPYIWATYVWNMFDFGADGREEGGANGYNQKGLVSFDRKIKKDAFYLYKAYLSKEPFIHICGRRYVDRTEKITTIKVYSNQASISLYDNGSLVATKQGEKIFEFFLKIDILEKGEGLTHDIRAVAGKISDEITIRKVEESNTSYTLKDKGINNWYENTDITFLEGYFSIKDTLGDIKENPQGKVIIEKILNVAKEKRGEVAQDLEKNEMLEEMLNRLSVEKLIQQSGGTITTEMVISLNQALSKIKKKIK